MLLGQARLSAALAAAAADQGQDDFSQDEAVAGASNATRSNPFEKARRGCVSRTAAAEVLEPLVTATKVSPHNAEARLLLGSAIVDLLEAVHPDDLAALREAQSATARKQRPGAYAKGLFPQGSKSHKSSGKTDDLAITRTAAGSERVAGIVLMGEKADPRLLLPDNDDDDDDEEDGNGQWDQDDPSESEDDEKNSNFINTIKRKPAAAALEAGSGEIDASKSVDEVVDEASVGEALLPTPGKHGAGKGETVTAWLSDARAIRELRTAARLARAVTELNQGEAIQASVALAAAAAGSAAGNAVGDDSTTTGAGAATAVMSGVKTARYQLYSSHASVRFAAFCRLGALCMARGPDHAAHAIAAYRFAIAAADDNDGEVEEGTWPNVPDAKVSAEEQQVAYQGLGDAAMLLGEPSVAVRAYAREAVLQPSDPYPHLRLGDALLAAKDATGALRSFQCAVRIAPRNGYAFYRLGVGLLAAARAREASDSARQWALLRDQRRVEAEDFTGVSAANLSPFGGEDHAGLETKEDAGKDKDEFYPMKSLFDGASDEIKAVATSAQRAAALSWLGGDLPFDLARLHTTLFGSAATHASLGESMDAVHVFETAHMLLAAPNPVHYKQPDGAAAAAGSVSATDAVTAASFVDASIVGQPFRASARPTVGGSRVLARPSVAGSIGRPQNQGQNNQDNSSSSSAALEPVWSPVGAAEALIGLGFAYEEIHSDIESAVKAYEKALPLLVGVHRPPNLRSLATLAEYEPARYADHSGVLTKLGAAQWRAGLDEHATSSIAEAMSFPGDAAAQAAAQAQANRPNFLAVSRVGSDAPAADEDSNQDKTNANLKKLTSPHEVEVAAVAAAAASKRRPHAAAHFLAAVVKEHAGEVEAALSHFTAAAEEDPAFVDALFNKGLMEQRLGFPEMAAASFREASTLDPTRADCLASLGSVMQSEGLLLGAAECYGASLTRDPNNADSRAALGSVLLLLGRPEAAVRELEAAVRLEPDHPIAPFQLTMLRDRMLEAGASLSDFRANLELRRSAVAIYPDKQYHWQQLGMEILKGLRVAGQRLYEDPLSRLVPTPVQYRRGAPLRASLLVEALAALTKAHELIGATAAKQESATQAEAAAAAAERDAVASAYEAMAIESDPNFPPPPPPTPATGFAPAWDAMKPGPVSDVTSEGAAQSVARFGPGAAPSMFATRVAAATCLVAKALIFEEQGQWDNAEQALDQAARQGVVHASPAPLDDLGGGGVASTGVLNKKSASGASVHFAGSAQAAASALEAVKAAGGLRGVSSLEQSDPSNLLGRTYEVAESVDEEAIVALSHVQVGLSVGFVQCSFSVCFYRSLHVPFYSF